MIHTSLTNPVLVWGAMTLGLEFFTTETALYGTLGLFLGFGGYIYLHNLALRGQIQDAEQTANDLIEQASEAAEDRHKEVQARTDEFIAQLEEKNEDAINELSEKVEQLKTQFDERKERLNTHFRGQQSLLDKKKHILKDNEDRIRKLESKYEGLKEQKEQLLEKYRQALQPVADTSIEDVKQTLIQKLCTEVKEETNKNIQELENQAQLDLEKNARRVLNLALNRFARPYCPERGIGNVHFPNKDVFHRTVGKERQFIDLLEKSSGVDITLNEENLYAQVLGFDPVRRELGRASLEKLMHEKNLNEKRINDIVSKTKKDLFKKIRKDGHAIAKELGIKGLSEEIQNMMGALRYRYSFAQNQFFHCAEVGWLCGLLSSELGVEVVKGRRAGMLHDIGKAMDHSKDGGHAVIGADFIEKNNEAQDIVHAVRAHHYDEQPSTPLAYLTIAADAISGARPGARRSTMDSYHQKMQNLEKIGKSFPGVTDTYILSAGREMRVSVNSREMDDLGALKLSQKIAQKIEEEMSYPGLIKVIVVRETHAIEVAR